ncbi:MAG: hypothetical protein A2050_08235 [Candidatus Rokubacteria bacterium GWA2_73_35]|nr:MAG: hypothetical protein A2050_08235 [Candidatus Rokubacteria bacterium GWA2_73_35]
MGDPTPSLLDALDAALVAVDPARAVSEWNRAMERLTGVARAAALGRPVDTVLPLLGDAELAARLDRALGGETPGALEIPHATAAGDGLTWLEARCVPWRGPDDRPAGAVLVFTDVTERHRRALFLHAIEAIGQSLSSSLDLNEVLDTIAGKALEVMGADAALVVSWDGVTPEFRILRAAGRLGLEYRALQAVSVGGGPIGRAVLERRPITTRNILTDPALWLPPERRAAIAREGYKAVAAAPLVAKGRVHGALVVHHWSERTFGAEEIEALKLLAEQAALAIDNATLYADATRRADRLRELAALEQLVTGSLDLDDVLRRIAQAAARLLEVPVVQVWVADAPGQRLRRRAASIQTGAADLARMPEALAFGEDATGRAAVTRAPLFVADVREDPRVAAREWAVAAGLTTLLAMPIVTGEATLGVFTVHAPAGSAWSPEDQALLAALAAQAAVAMQNAAKYAEAVARAARLRDLAAVSQAVSALDTTDVMQRITDAAAALGPGALAAVHTLEAASGLFRHAVDSGPEWEHLPPAPPAESGLPGLVVEERRPVLVEAPATHPRTRMPGWWAARPGASYYGVPIVAGGSFVGVLTYISRQGPPTQEVQEVLGLLAAQAAVATQNARLYREAARRRDVNELLARLGRELTATLDPERIAELLAQGIAGLVDARAAVVYRHDPETRRLRALAWSGVDATAVAALELEPGEGIAGRAVAERRVVVSRDILADPAVRLTPAVRARVEASGFRVTTGVPLLTHERVIGALAVGAAPGREPSGAELQALEALADQASLAFENARLYASARDSLQRLHETQAQLVQAAKMSALGQLVSGVAHELNNPLSVIVGYGQLLLAREIPQPLQRPIELILSQADRMAKIVRNLLLFSRQRPPERTAVDLNVVVEQTLGLRQNQLALSGIEVVRELTPELPPIAGDIHQIEQVFLNLLLNAEQAILEGEQGGHITVRTRVAEAGRAVEAEVEDDGPGIAPAAFPHVFEPFFTTKTVGSGTGLGLSVSYGIVQEHGGRLGVESRPGRTVFTLALPTVQPSALPRAGDADAQAQPFVVQGRAALVVEDDAAVLDLVCVLLGQTGWRVDVASGGREGLERVRARRYDLIVSDLRMAEGGGEEFYRSALLEDPSLQRRFVFITGDTANRGAWHFLRDGHVPVIEKPFQPALFLDAVRRVTTSLTPSA